jgi:hypothetical protein
MAEAVIAATLTLSILMVLALVQELGHLFMAGKPGVQVADKIAVHTRMSSGNGPPDSKEGCPYADGLHFIEEGLSRKTEPKAVDFSLLRF